VVVLAWLFGTPVFASAVAHAATVTVINNDGPDEGFNDPTPASPVGGNSGTTLGAQRLIAFQRAADIWGALLDSAVKIRVNATFDPQACSATSAVLGSAGPTTAVRDFAGAPVPATWYPIALANALHGSDLDAGADINAQFNSAFGTTCPFPNSWYYGLDGNAGNHIDFLTVALHELSHGLGFLTFVDLASGAKMLGHDDAFMLNLENHGADPPDYPSMTDAQRLSASLNTGNLHWVGPRVRAASGFLTAGKVGDHVQMFAPNPRQGGTPVSHWDAALMPNQLLEPFYTSPLDPGLELWLLQDIGWTMPLSVLLTPSPATGPTPLSTTLKADVSGTAVGTIDYTYWWNCADPGTSVSEVTAACGDPTDPAIGAKFHALAATSQSTLHVYASAGTFTAKVIAERGSAAPAEMRTIIAAGEVLQVTPATDMSSSGAQGGPFWPAAFQYQLRATSGSVNFSISGVPSWLTASAASGTVTTSTTTVTFTVNAGASSLASGLYGPTTISFTNTTNGVGNTTRLARLNVEVPSSLAVTPATDVAASGRLGGPFSPSVFQYVLTTEGAASGLAEFSISGVPSWLTASATSGTAAKGSGTIVTFTVNASANARAPGVYGPTTITFTHTNGRTPNATRTATLTVAPGVLGDYDGDGRRDLAVYRPTTAEWFVFGNATGFQTSVFGAPSLGGLGDLPVPADFDGDGKTDMAVYRPATGEWFIFGSATGFQTRVFGAPSASGLGDTPVPADFDGDGKADMAIYRKATGEWFIFGTATGFQTRVFGAPAVSGLDDTPLAADFDGDGKADVAIYRKTTGEWFIFGSAAGFQTRVFGAPSASGLGDTPVPMDFDGDGRTDVAIYRKATAEWFILGSATGFRTTVFGAPAVSGLGDTPMPGDFDGDGKADVAVRRSATAEWFVLQSSTGQVQTTIFGAPADLPLPQPAP
jgi:hypothetical protein